MINKLSGRTFLSSTNLAKATPYAASSEAHLPRAISGEKEKIIEDVLFSNK